MQLHKKLNLRRWFLLGFALVCIALNVVVYGLYEKNQEIQASKQWVNHTYEVIGTANELFFKIQDMQIALRGFLLTGDEKFLAPYHQADKSLDEKYAALATLTSGNVERQRELLRLKSVLEKQRGLMQRQIELRRSGGNFLPQDMKDSKALMDEIRIMNMYIVGDEQKLLNERSRRETKRQRNYMRSIFATAGVSIIGLLFANGLIGFLSLRRLDAEEDLRRTNHEMEGFTYIASHDLRSPLVNLKGFSTEMSYGLKELEPILERALEHVSEEDRKKAREILDVDIPDSLKYIHSSVEKMNKLTNGILELSRIGKRNLRIKPVNVRGIVQRSVDALQHQISTRNIKVAIGELPEVVSDSLSLEQIFGNILDNAIKYLDPARSGEIEIGGIKGRTQTTYWVKDNGRGIAESDVAKIFEIYRRAGINAHIPGEGLGMAYVRTTLRRLGGRIWVESVQGRGSIFYFNVDNVLKKEGNNNA
ncbi:MAG: integral rane sensor signal transduction histidine kinase [Alphaproteobacteria bacterium]|nr:integral rane sensor signal transduction histidine kinase [Alphaproteobacteria bacterium]